MYTELPALIANSGNPGGQPTSAYLPFQNILPAGQYWSGTIPGSANECAYDYEFLNSQLGWMEQWTQGIVMAVHDGNIATEVDPAPIPGAILLFAPGLVGLAAIRRRFGK